MKKITLSVSAIIGIFVLTACSNNSTTDDITGQFIDAPVSGLNYECNSSNISGTTNSAGEYTCKNGDKITFFVGKYKLGTIDVSSGIITPYSFDTDGNDEAAIHIAQLLQTLDSNTSDGIITIPSGYSELNNFNTSITSRNFEAEFESKIGKSLIDRNTAEQKMNQDIVENAPKVDLKSKLSGRTFYEYDYDSDYEGGKEYGCLVTITFNAEVTLVERKDKCEGKNESTGSREVTIENNRLIVEDDEGESIIYIGETNDYLILGESESFDGKTYFGVFKLYFDKEKAKSDAIKPTPYPTTNPYPTTEPTSNSSETPTSTTKPTVTPTLLGSYDTAGYAIEATLSRDGSKAYVADDENGLVIIDVTNPTSPALLGSYDTAGYATVV